MTQEEMEAQIISLNERVRQLEEMFRKVSHKAPDRPRSTDIRYADGTNWDPGDGEGYYAYEGGSWNKLS